MNLTDIEMTSQYLVHLYTLINKIPKRVDSECEDIYV